MSDVRNDTVLSEEEQEVALDEKVAAEPAEPAKTEYIEYVGEKPYGTEFLVEHSVSRKHLKEYHDLTTDKDLSWTKGKNGRMLVPVSDMTPEVAEFLEGNAQFRRVTL